MTEIERDGGLPKVDSPLAGFAADTLAPRRRRRRETEEDAAPPTAAPAAAPQAPSPPAAAEPAEPEASVPEQREQAAPDAPARAEVAVRQVADPQPAAVFRPLVPVAPPAAAAGDDRTTQCTINVSASVRDRFADFQLKKKLEVGNEPTNAVVVRWAVLHAHREGLWSQMREYVRHRQAPTFAEDDDPDGLFGDVPAGRQTVRGRARDTVQQTFRPSLAELARYDQLAAQYGFANRSEFLDAALEVYLPALDKRRR
jgi:hypothetical protein